MFLPLTLFDPYIKEAFVIWQDEDWEVAWRLPPALWRKCLHTLLPWYVFIAKSGSPRGSPLVLWLPWVIACAPDELEKQTSVISPAPAVRNASPPWLPFYLYPPPFNFFPLESCPSSCSDYLPSPGVTVPPLPWYAAPLSWPPPQLKAPTFWLRKRWTRHKSCSVVLWIFSVVIPDLGSTAQMIGRK